MRTRTIDDATLVSYRYYFSLKDQQRYGVLRDSEWSHLRYDEFEVSLYGVILAWVQAGLY